MRHVPPKKPDAITLLAQAGAAKRRRSPVPILVSVAIVVGVLTLLAWWIWPGAEPRQLVLAGYDALARPGDSVTLRAQIEPLDPETAGVRLSGYDLYFVEPGSELEAKVATDEAGAGSVEHTFAGPAEAPVEVIVRGPGRDGRRGAPETSTRVFLWPAEAPLLVVDADHALADAEPADFQAGYNPDIRPLPGALAALQALAGTHHVVYLTAEADRPVAYLKLAAWLRRSWAPVEQFPDGPLLGRALHPEAEDAAGFRRAALAGLKERFHGPAVGLARRPEEARLFHAAGLRTFLIGGAAEAPEGVAAIASWAELMKRLEK